MLITISEDKSIPGYKSAVQNLHKVLPPLKEICYMIKNKFTSLNRKKKKTPPRIRAIDADAILYKLSLDFYYQLYLQKARYKVILEKVLPIAIRFYKFIAKPVFNHVISCLYLIR